MITVLREHKRWLVAGLLFFISTIAFLDRQTLSVLEKTLEEILGFSAVEYSYIVMGFLIATGLGYIFAGGIIDRFGVRSSFAVALTVWSVAAVAHSLATGWISFLVLRIVLGLGESFYTPAAARVLRDWIPQRERGVCWAVFSSGNFVGGMIAPPLVAWLALRYHWQFSFVATGASGFLLLAVWLWFYRSPERQLGCPPQSGRLFCMAGGQTRSHRKTSQSFACCPSLRSAAFSSHDFSRIPSPFSSFFGFRLISKLRTVSPLQRPA